MVLSDEQKLERIQLSSDWKQVLREALLSERMDGLREFLKQQLTQGQVIYPPTSDWFKAFDLTAPRHVKVVILGQDPYHGPGQAMGLCFSVPEGVKIPPSLVNIYKELEADLGVARADHGDLSKWARQGVLLLNNTLTVEAAKAGSHAKRGWDAITDACVAAVAARDQPSVFILWGSHAQAKAKRIAGLREGQHCVIESPHPSPLSAHRGFFGSKPFSRTNAFLSDHGREAIDWAL